LPSREDYQEIECQILEATIKEGNDEEGLDASAEKRLVLSLEDVDSGRVFVVSLSESVVAEAVGETLTARQFLDFPKVLAEHQHRTFMLGAPRQANSDDPSILDAVFSTDRPSEKTAKADAIELPTPLRSMRMRRFDFDESKLKA